MLEIIKSPTENIFLKLIRNCHKEMTLCAPFIKYNLVEKIIKNKNEESKLKVITSSNISNFILGSSDLSAIKFLIDSKVAVYNYQNLHAKIYLFDKSKALITSANLTPSGMNYNYEYGILIDKETNLINQIENDLMSMQEKNNQIEESSIIVARQKIIDIEKTKYIIKEVDGDNILVTENFESILTNTDTWQKSILLAINKIKSDNFTLQQIYLEKDKLSTKYPNNNNIEAKIRQVLQQLRDLGLIKFTKRGHYKKLFASK